MLNFNYSLTRARDDLVMSLIAALSLTLFAIFVTYSSQDPGWTNSSSAVEIFNIGGITGAYIADIGYWLLGICVLVIPIALIAFCWMYLYRWKNQAKDQLLSPILFLIGTVLTLTGISGIENSYILNNNAGAPPGGVLGNLTASFVTAYLPFQVSVVLFLCAVIIGTALAGVPWMVVSEFVGRAIISTFKSVLPSRREPAYDDDVSVQPQRNFEQDFEQEPVQVPRKKLSKPSLFAKSSKPKTKKPEAKKRSKRRTESKRVEPIIGSIGQVDAEGIDSPEVREVKQKPITSKAPPRSTHKPPQQTKSGGSKFKLPALSLLDRPHKSRHAYSRKDIATMASKVETMLSEFGVEVTVENAHPGPVITQLEVQPAPGVKASQIVNLNRDLARSLAVSSVRVVDNIPGSPYVGIEVPNRMREAVRFLDGLESEQYKQSNSPLSIVLGKDIRGSTVVSSLDKMPHLLIAGTTGAGKSVCLNAILLSFLYKSTPDQIRLIMVDPKMLEFSVYDGIPHLLTPVITDMEKTENALRWCIAEMEARYTLMSQLGVRSLEGYNDRIRSSAPIPNPLKAGSPEPSYLSPFPYIVVVIDELADLIMVMGRKAEDLIIRIAQRARAAGIHLIVATQRPSTDVIKGLLKANIPTRIGFKVASNADSRTILDQPGAETLLGQGDMLFLAPGSSEVMRVHGAFISDDEVKRVVDALKLNGPPVYVSEVVSSKATDGSNAEFGGNDIDGENDEYYDEAVNYVIQSQRPTISSVQRKFRIGYNRAARLIETMEHAGLVSPADVNGKREVLVPPPPED